LRKRGRKPVSSFYLTSHLRSLNLPFRTQQPVQRPSLAPPPLRPLSLMYIIYCCVLRRTLLFVLVLLHILEHRFGLVLSPCCGKKKPRQQNWNKQHQSTTRRKEKALTPSPLGILFGQLGISEQCLSGLQEEEKIEHVSMSIKKSTTE
jgi:hypothetical protein